MEFIDEALDAYCHQHSSPESELLHRLNRETHAKILKPRMLSGHLQGRMLAMISQMLRPTNILEIGTYTGYSALCLAEGLQNNGKIITIDVNEELEDFTRNFFNESAFKNLIDFRLGNALEIIPTLSETLDLVFIDADKKSYARYYDLVFEKVRTGGIIMADNVLWSGKVVENNMNDKETIDLRNFNLKIQQDIRVENALFPLRDGLMIIRKI
jgi:caffeoyl-CoA O-methyltransferase